MHVPTASSSSMEEASHGPTASSSSMEEVSTQASLGGGVSDSSTSASAGKRRPRTQGQGDTAAGGPEGYLRSLWNSFFGDATEKVMDKRIVVTMLLLGVSSLVTWFGCSQTTVVVVNALSSTAAFFHAASLLADFELSRTSQIIFIVWFALVLSPGANAATPISGTDAGCGYDAANPFLWNILRLFSSFFLFAMVIRVLWSTTLIMLALMFRLRLNAA